MCKNVLHMNSLDEPLPSHRPRHAPSLTPYVGKGVQQTLETMIADRGYTLVPASACNGAHTEHIPQWRYVAWPPPNVKASPIFIYMILGRATVVNIRSMMIHLVAYAAHLSQKSLVRVGEDDSEKAAAKLPAELSFEASTERLFSLPSPLPPQHVAVTHAIWIQEEDVTNTIRQQILSHFDVELFVATELYCNCTRHVLVPRHTWVDPSTVPLLLKTHGLQSVKDFPGLPLNDPIVRYHHWPVDSIIRIDVMFGDTCEPHTSYKRVTPPQQKKANKKSSTR